MVLTFDSVLVLLRLVLWIRQIREHTTGTAQVSLPLTQVASSAGRPHDSGDTRVQSYLSRLGRVQTTLDTRVSSPRCYPREAAKHPSAAIRTCRFLKKTVLTTRRDLHLLSLKLQPYYCQTLLHRIRILYNTPRISVYTIHQIHRLEEAVTSEPEAHPTLFTTTVFPDSPVTRTSTVSTPKPEDCSK